LKSFTLKQKVYIQVSFTKVVKLKMSNKLLTYTLFIIGILLVLSIYQNYALNQNIKNLLGQSEGKSDKELNQVKNQVNIPVNDKPFKGEKNAPVTIIEFSDFQCPYCERFYIQTLPQIEEQYIKTGKAKFVYKHFPLTFHQFAQKAAEASECANEQGKFWQYHNKIFENQRQLNNENLKKWASELELDAKKFNECIDSGRMKDKVQQDMDDGINAGISGTPGFFINDVKLVGAQPFDAFKQAIDSQLNS